MRKLRVQLLLSYLPLVIVPLLVIGVAANRAAEQGLSLLVRQDARQYVESLIPCLSGYYRMSGSWDNLHALFKQGKEGLTLSGLVEIVSNEGNQSAVQGQQWILFLSRGLPQCALMGYGRVEMRNPGVGRQGNPMNPPLVDPAPGEAGQPPVGVIPLRENMPITPETLILVSPQALILASTDGERLGMKLDESYLAGSVPILIDGQIVGRALVGTGLGILNQRQQQTLGMITTGVIAAAVISGLLAMGFGLLFSWRISAPLKALMIGVRQLGAGVWVKPIEVHSRNEFGDLTEAFNRMAAEITRQDQLHRQMVADIAHDLRTPLSVMMLEIEAVEAGFQSPREATVSLREEVRWLQRMVDDLRLLSLLDADQMRLKPEPVHLSNFLQETYDFWRTAAEAEGRVLRLDAALTLPTLELDPGRMRQVIGNLLDNAIRHTRPGDEICLRAQLESGYMLIEVRDQGEGIPAEDLPFIFDRFYRADRSRSQDQKHREGSGLGLSIAHQLIELHGGSIQAFSQVGYGTTFQIRLPLPGQIRQPGREGETRLTRTPARGIIIDSPAVQRMTESRNRPGAD